MGLVGQLLGTLARRLPFSVSMRAVQLLLREQGIGAGADVRTSGEAQVFELISAKAPVLFDVGGHLGAYSKAFLSRFPDGKVFLFEPSAVHVAQARASLPAQVRFFTIALSDRDGAATLYKDAEVTGLASLTKRDLAHRDIQMDLSETIACRTLDGVVAEEKIDRIDLLKIDVEGHELDVLRGGQTSFARGLIGVVQFEFGGCNLDTRTTLHDFFRFFAPLGYALYLVRPTGGLVALGAYRELYEQYQTTNYVAMRRRAGD